jgi:hypothetical protein
MAAGFAPGSKQALAYLQRLLVAQHVDPQAAMRVFNVEGASGGIGDGGHAFGPGQFNNAGGVWTGRYAGLSPQQINQIAWSPQGLAELAQRVGKVAGGLKGAAAVRNIVTRFERPADPRGEIAKALGGSVSAAPAGAIGAPLGGFAAPQGLNGAATGADSGLLQRQALMQNLIAQQNAFLGGGEYTGPTLPQTMQNFNLIQQAQGGSPFFATPQGQAPAVNTAYSTKGKVKFLGATSGENPRFLSALGQAVAAAGGSQVKLTSGYRDPAHNAAVGGVKGSLHTRGEAMDGYALIGGRWVPLGTALRGVAAKYGLRSGDVPGFFNGRPDPVHVDYGYRA